MCVYQAVERAYREEKAQLEHHLKLVERELQQLQGKWHQRASATQQELTACKRERDDIRVQCGEYQQQVAALHAERDLLQRRLRDDDRKRSTETAALKDRVQTYKAERSALRSEVRDARAEVTRLKHQREEDMKARVREISLLQQEVSSYKEALSARDKNITQLEQVCTVCVCVCVCVCVRRYTNQRECFCCLVLVFFFPCGCWSLSQFGCTCVCVMPLGSHCSGRLISSRQRIAW